MEERFTFTGSSGENVSAIFTSPEKPDGRAVILLHCFLCTKNQRIMRAISGSLLGKGIASLRFDFYGNGESGGVVEDSTYTKMLGQIKDAVSLVQGRGMGRIGVCGHSMGAMLGLLAADQDKRIDAVAFLAGSSQAARVREVFPIEVVELAELEGHSHASVYGRDIKLKREFLLDIERFNVGHAAAMLKRPFLIVHGGHDEVIPFYHARQMHNWAHEPKSLVVIPEADHLFKREGHLAELREVVARWFADVL